MNIILGTIAISCILAFTLGVLLGVFKKIFAVETDPKIQEITDALSGINCGGCGYAGCSAFAAAVAAGQAPANGCVAGGAATAEKVAKILGVSVETSEKKIAFTACKGTKSCAKPRGIYNGVKTCKAAQLAVNGTKLCAFGCIGYGDCVSVCPFGALSMNNDGLPEVDRNKCTGCGKCTKACPKGLLHLINASTKGAVAVCSNHSDNKPQIKKNCSAGCIKCGICAKKCPQQAIDVSSGIPQVDYTKCTSCGECVTACPDKVMVIL